MTDIDDLAFMRLRGVFDAVIAKLDEHLARIAALQAAELTDIKVRLDTMEKRIGRIEEAQP